MEAYKKKLEAIVITWLEVKDKKPTFQKRTYKDVNLVKAYLERKFTQDAERISHVQVKLCYQLDLVDKAESDLI